MEVRWLPGLEVYDYGTGVSLPGDGHWLPDASGVGAAGEGHGGRDGGGADDGHESGEGRGEVHLGFCVDVETLVES